MRALRRHDHPLLPPKRAALGCLCRPSGAADLQPLPGFRFGPVFRGEDRRKAPRFRIIAAEHRRQNLQALGE